MKIVRYLYDGQVCHGLLEGSTISRIEGSIMDQYEVVEQRVDVNQVRLLAPVTPNKIIAIGLNYKKHAEEMNKPVPDEPLMFLVSPTAVIGQHDVIKIKNAQHRTEHEGELAIIIGKQAECVSPERALDYVLGYTCCNDISDRDLQKKDGQFTRAKSFTTYKPIGPVIATDIDPDRAGIRVLVNGEVRQDSNTNDMIFKTAEIISFVSHVMKLEPYDVIITGTPSGVSPLLEGDIVEVQIEGIGSLVNKVESNLVGG